MLTLAGLVRTHGRDRADHPYLHFQGETITYAELDERSNRVAAGLTAAGVGRGDRVALLSKNSPECFDVMFGAAKCGAVHVPVNWRLAAPEIAYIVDHAEARVLVVGSEYADLVADLRDQLPKVELVLQIGSSYDDWVAAQEPVDPGVECGPDDVAVQMYTSGTTGLPKGAMLTGGNLLGTMARQCEQWSYDQDSVNLVPMPLFHIGGTGTALLSVVPGATTVLMPEVDPAGIIELIGRHRVTNMLMVPAIIAFVLDVPGAASADWSSLRTLMYGASPISDTLLLRAMDTMKCSFVQLYGITEHSGCVAQLQSEFHDPENRPGLLRSCGKPLPWVECKAVVPGSDGIEAAAGEVGELWVRSPQVMAGYWRQPEETAAALTADGWFRTGDAGYFDDEGFLYLHDRIKDMIVSGGENVYPAEIENALMRHETVADVAVIGVPSERWGETPKAIVVAKPGATVDESEIIAFCRTQLAGYKCPTSVDVVEVLPRNAAGKILKKDLRERYWAGHDRRVH